MQQDTLAQLFNTLAVSAQSLEMYYSIKRVFCDNTFFIFDLRLTLFKTFKLN